MKGTTRKPRASRRRKQSVPAKTGVICFNKDCKLRKQRSCKGFEACPGFQGR